MLPNNIALEVRPGCFVYYTIQPSFQGTPSHVLPLSSVAAQAPQRKSLFEALSQIDVTQGSDKVFSQSELQKGFFSSQQTPTLPTRTILPPPIGATTTSLDDLQRQQEVAQKVQLLLKEKPVTPNRRESSISSPSTCLSSAISLPARKQSCQKLSLELQPEEPSAKRQKVDDDLSIIKLLAREVNLDESISNEDSCLKLCNQAIRSSDTIQNTESDNIMKPISLPVLETGLKKKKIYLDKFKKHLIRLFRTHLHKQFDSIYQRKHYRWIDKSKRNAIYEFFTGEYNVPIDEFYRHEGIFARLILNTVKDLHELDIKVDPQMDKAMVHIFKQQPNIKNTQTFFSNEIIQKIWHNKWGGSVQAFADTEDQIESVRKADPRELSGLIKQFELVKVNHKVFLGPECDSLNKWCEALE